VNWHSKRQVLALILVVAVVMAIGGMAAAWHNRGHTICADGKPPLEQRGGLLGQTVYRCHNGELVTTPG
jgi:hypothetical protein